MVDVWSVKGGKIVRRSAGEAQAWTPAVLEAQWALQTRPSGAGYVRYEDVYQAGDTFQQTLNRVPAGADGKPQILTLPNITITINDFKNGWYDGVRIGTSGAVNVRGIVGSGKGSIIRIAADSATRERPDLGGKLCGEGIVAARGIADCVFSNFQLQGAESMKIGGVEHYYNGLFLQECHGAEISWLYLRGANPGYANYPPGETFGVDVYRCHDVTIRDCEMDGRTVSGRRSCASPFGWNGSMSTTSVDNFWFAERAKVYRTYCHHGLTGHPTWWITDGIYTEDLWSFSPATGTGVMAGFGMNHEQCRGSAEHVRTLLYTHGPNAEGEPPAPLPSLANTPRTNNNRFPFSVLSTVEDTTANMILREPMWDKSYAGSGLLIMAAYDDYGGAETGLGTSKAVTPPTIIKNGVQLQVVHHPNAGWNTANPATHFAWVH